MKTGMTLLNAGSTADRVLKIISGVVDEERDPTRQEAEQIRQLATSLQCHALRLEREVLGIPEPKRG